VFKGTVSVKPDGRVDFYLMEGEVVEVRDRNHQSGYDNFVRCSGQWLYRLTGEWHVHRWEALVRSAEQLDEIAGRIAAKAAELRHQAEDAINELRPLPAEGAVFAGPGESAAGGRDETPAAQDQGLHH
jgi:hypothetical protein